VARPLSARHNVIGITTVELLGSVGGCTHGEHVQLLLTLLTKFISLAEMS
jgi:hypothetical protein